MLRDLELSDIPELAGFAPKEWNMALDALLLDHFERGYFHAARVSVELDRSGTSPICPTRISPSC